MTRARDVANLIGSGNYSSTTFTATAGQTAFTISHTQGFIQVFMNGLLLDETVDYTSNGSAVTLTSGAAAGDEIEVVAYNTFSVGDALNQSAADTRYVNTSGDTMTGALTVDTSTTTNLNVDSANYGGIQLKAAGTDTGYITSYTNGSGTESMYIGGADNVLIHTGTNHALSNGTTRLQINASGHVTMPNQPSMSGRSIRPVSASGYASLNVNLYLNDLQHNIGNHWNNTTGVWTCPVAGRYWVFVSILIDDNMSNGNVARYEIRKNGSEFFRGYDQSYNSGSTYGGMIASGGIFNCSANDTITVVGTNGTLHTGAESTFTICLLS